MNIDEFHGIGDWDARGDRQMACVIIRDVFGRFLMQLRDDFPHVKGGGKWSIFGGEIEAGETPIEAAIREMQEEIGIRFEQDELEPHSCFVAQSTGNQFFIFAATEYIQPEQIRLGEGAGFAFLTAMQVIDVDLANTIQDLMHNLAQDELL